MKKFNYKMMFVAMAAVATVACGNDSEGNDWGDSTFEGATLYIPAGADYELTGPVIADAGQTISIEAGARIVAKDNGELSYILIKQGAKIIANGTATNPIIMTAENQSAGAWGGIHICGKAPINTGSNLSEIGSFPYGGDDAADNSGELTYVRVEYAGYQHTNEKEANGFTFYGVGNGTKLSHLVAYKGSDDGYEWFGGTVDATYLISVGNNDDSFDWTEGWCGRGQFWIADQIGAGCDQTFEGDNSKSDYTLSPISCPTIANVTLIGDDYSSDLTGILLRNGTYCKLYNILATGKSGGDLVIDGTDSGDTNGSQTPTDTSLDNGSSVLRGIYLGGSFVNKAGAVAKYTSTDFANDGNVENYAGSILYNTTITTADFGLDASFFVATSYAGAYSTANAQNWNMTSTWTGSYLQ